MLPVRGQMMSDPNPILGKKNISRKTVSPFRLMY